MDNTGIVEKIIKAKNIQKLPIIKLSSTQQIEEFIKLSIDNGLQVPENIIKFISYIDRLDIKVSIKNSASKIIQIYADFVSNNLETSDAKILIKINALNTFIGHLFNCNLILDNVFLVWIRMLIKSKSNKFIAMNILTIVELKLNKHLIDPNIRTTEVLSNRNFISNLQIIHKIRELYERMKIFGDFEVKDEEMDDEAKYAFCVPSHPIEALIEEILTSISVSLSNEIEFLLDFYAFQCIVEKPHFYNKAVECLRKLDEKHLRERYYDLTDFRYFETQYAEVYFSIDFRNFAEESDEWLVDEDESSPMHVKFLLSNIIDSDNSKIQRYVDLLQVNEVLSCYLIEACENVIAKSEFLMEYSHISRLQFFALIKFIGHLYNSKLMEFDKIRVIFSQLENQNRYEILKHLSFLIFEKSKSETDEDFKRNVRNYIKNVTAASIFIDEIYDGYSQSLIDATIINTFGLSTFTKTLIQKAFELYKFDPHFHLISMKLFEIYANFSKILFTHFKKELKNAFNVPVGHDLDWKMIEKLGKMIYFAYEKDILKDNGACMVEFFNIMIIHADLKGFQILADIFIYVFTLLKNKNREAFFNYLEHFYDIMRDKDIPKELKEILNPIMEEFDKQLMEFNEKCVAANPRFKRFVEEMTRVEEIDPDALEIPNTTILIKDAKLCAQYFFAFGTTFPLNQFELTEAVTLWKSQKQDEEHAKFIPELTEICMATFKNQHMDQNGYKDRPQTIATSCFISELLKTKAITIEKYEEFITIVMHSVATNSCNMNIRCFHHMVTMIDDYLYQTKISKEMVRSICVMKSMLRDMTKTNPVNFMLRRVEPDITTQFDEYLKKFESAPMELCFDWKLMEMEELFKSADKIVMSVKRFKHDNFTHLLEIVNNVKLLWPDVRKRLAGKVVEQIAFETKIKLQENYDWSAMKNLSNFAAFLCENQISEFDFTVDYVMKDIFETVLNYESKYDRVEYSNQAKRMKLDDSMKLEFRKRYTKILHQVIKKCTRMKDLKKLENFYEVLETQSNEYDEMLRVAVRNISMMFKKSPNNEEYDLIDSVTTGVDEIIIEDPEGGIRSLFQFVIQYPITKVNKFRKTIEPENDENREFYYWVFEDATHEVIKKAWTTDQYEPREIAGAARLLSELYKKNKIKTEIFSECLKIIIERCSENPSKLDLICLLYAGSQSLHLITKRNDIDQKIINDVKESAYKYRERMTNLFTNYVMGTDDDFDDFKSDKKS